MSGADLPTSDLSRASRPAVDARLITQVPLQWRDDLFEPNTDPLLSEKRDTETLGERSEREKNLERLVEREKRKRMRVRIKRERGWRGSTEGREMQERVESERERKEGEGKRERERLRWLT